MAATEFALNSALAVQRWSPELAYEAEKRSYFRKFMGTGDAAVIKVLKDLNKKAGEKITYGLRMKPDGDGSEGDYLLEGSSAEKRRLRRVGRQSWLTSSSTLTESSDYLRKNSRNSLLKSLSPGSSRTLKSLR